MIPYEVDPSLHTGKPDESQLDDGFSPPHPEQPLAPASPSHGADLPPVGSADPLAQKSGF